MHGDYANNLLTEHEPDGHQGDQLEQTGEGPKPGSVEYYYLPEESKEHYSD